MCPWVGLHDPSCGQQLWGLPSGMEYLSPQGVWLPRVYSTTASPLWLELQGPVAWQATSSPAVCRHACHQLLPWLWATFAMVPDAVWARTSGLRVPLLPLARWVGSVTPVRLTPGGVDRCALSLCSPRCMCVCGVLAHLAPVHWCARCVRFACAVGGCVPPPPRHQFMLPCLFGFALYLVRKRHRHVFLGGLDPGLTPPKSLLLMLRLI